MKRQAAIFALALAVMCVDFAAPVIAQHEPFCRLVVTASIGDLLLPGPEPDQKPSCQVNPMLNGALKLLPAPVIETLPPIDSIDAKTDVTVFLQSGVPEEMRIAALRRVWATDPAIHDFKGLQEVDWDFTNISSIPGFGEIGPEVDTKSMLTEIFGDIPHPSGRLAKQSDDRFRVFVPAQASPTKLFER